MNKYDKSHIDNPEEHGLSFTLNNKRVGETPIRKLVKPKYWNVDIDPDLLKDFRIVLAYRRHTIGAAMAIMVEQYITEGIEEIRVMLERNKQYRVDKKGSDNDVKI